MEAPKAGLTAAQEARNERYRQRCAKRDSENLISKEGESSRETKKKGSKRTHTANESRPNTAKKVLRNDEPAPKIAKINNGGGPAGPTCVECQEDCSHSFLYECYGVHICNKCKTRENAAKICKSNVKKEFMLQYKDFAEGDSQLPFIYRKNPHYASAPPMMLYLKSQVEARALEVHGSLEKIAKLKRIQKMKREIAARKKREQSNIAG